MAAGASSGASAGGSGSWSQARRRTVWIIIGIAVGAILVAKGNADRVGVIIFCVLVPSIILHEVTHGWVALAFGDDTARRSGRLSLNPIAHVDPIGTIVVPAILAFSGFGLFGWAKPVPVDVQRLRFQRNATVLVSLAGPGMNFLISFGAAWVFTHSRGVIGGPVGAPDLTFKGQILFSLGLVNLWLGAFNLIPIPPLDGSAVLERFLPKSLWPKYLRYRRYTFPLFFGFVMLCSMLGGGPLRWLSEHVSNWWATWLSH